MISLGNIGAVARREFGVRVRTRSFIFGTLLLVVGVAIIASLPVIIRYVDRSNSEKVAVYVAATDLPTDPVPTLTALLNPAPTSDQAAPGLLLHMVSAARQAASPSGSRGRPCRR